MIESSYFFDCPVVSAAGSTATKAGVRSWEGRESHSQSTMSVCRVGLCIAAILLLSTAAEAEKQSSSYSKVVRQFCRADYKKYCGEYGLETTALRSCMDRNGESLSKACVRALVKDGHVSQADVNRRKKAARR